MSRASARRFRWPNPTVSSKGSRTTVRPTLSRRVKQEWPCQVTSTPYFAVPISDGSGLMAQAPAVTSSAAPSNARRRAMLAPGALEPAGRLDGVVGDDDVGAGPLDGGENLESGAQLGSAVEPPQ